MSSGLFSGKKGKAVKPDPSPNSSAWESQNESDHGQRKQQKKKPAAAQGWADEWHDIDNPHFFDELRKFSLHPFNHGSPHQERMRGTDDARPKPHLLLTKQLSHSDGKNTLLLEIEHVRRWTGAGGPSRVTYHAFVMNSLGSNIEEASQYVKEPTLSAMQSTLKEILVRAGVGEATFLAEQACGWAKQADPGMSTVTLNHVASSTTLDRVSSMAFGKEENDMTKASNKERRHLNLGEGSSSSDGEGLEIPRREQASAAQKTTPAAPAAPESSYHTWRKSMSPEESKKPSGPVPPLDVKKHTPPKVTSFISRMTKEFKGLTTSASGPAEGLSAKPKKSQVARRPQRTRTVSGPPTSTARPGRGKKLSSRLKASTRPGTAAGTPEDKKA